MNKLILAVWVLLLAGCSPQYTAAQKVSAELYCKTYDTRLSRTLFFSELVCWDNNTQTFYSIPDEILKGKK